MEKCSNKCLATGFTNEHLNEDFFSSIVGDRGKLISWEELQLDTSNSILSSFATKDDKRKVGHFTFRVNFESGKGPSSLTVVVKAKALDVDIANVVNDVAQVCGGDLAPVYEKFKMKDEFRYGDVREVEMANLKDAVLRQYSPIIYHTINEPTKEIRVLVMECLDSENVTLLNIVNDPWQLSDIKVVLRDLAKIHSSFLTKQQWLTSQYWLDVESAERMMRMQPLWAALLHHAEITFPEMWTKDNCTIIRRAFELIPSLWSILEQAPRTLVHNDCNPRNICLRKPTSDTKSLTTASDKESCKKTGVPFSDDRCLCMYDWELVYAGAPQHDVVEFLSFTLPSSATHSMRRELIEFYRHHLEYYSGREFPVEKFHEVYNICCLDFAMNRVLMYTMVHTPSQSYKFLPKVVQTLFDHLTHEIATGGLKLE